MATPITNDHFQTRINALISDHLSGDSIPTVPPLTHLDTVLVPGARAKTLLVFTPSWIEICAPDPMVSEISKQILHMEVAYAVFCGAPQLFVQGPKIYHRDPFLGKDLFTNNVTQFARAIHDALSLGNRIHISIVLPFYDDSSSTASYPPTIETREQYLDDVFDERSTVTDGLVPWDSWNTIRTFCKYPSRLNAGKMNIRPFTFTSPYSMKRESFIRRAKLYSLLLLPLAHHSHEVLMTRQPWSYLGTCHHSTFNLVGFQSLSEL